MPIIKFEIKALVDNLVCCSNADDPEQLSSKACTLVKLWRAAKRGEYEGEIAPTEILNTFTRAIMLNPEEPLYLIDRSEFCIELGNEDSAIVDYLKAKSVANVVLSKPDNDIIFSRNLKTRLDALENKLRSKLPVQSVAPVAVSTQQQPLPDRSSVLVNTSLFSANSAQAASSGENSEEIETLLRSIKSHLRSINRAIEKNMPTMALSVYDGIIRDYMSLSKLTGDDAHYKTAMSYYDEVIRLSPNNPNYYIDRAISHMEKTDIYHALSDILVANTLSENDGLNIRFFNDSIKAIVNKIKSMAGNSLVSSAINRLEEEGKISTANPRWLDDLTLHFTQMEDAVRATSRFQ
jgi:tetratricopeptide (TPR) repeat protein